MSEIQKILGLLKSEAIEKQIAAAIVLGELRAKAPGTVEALAVSLESGVPLLQLHALEALSRIGAKKALPQIFPLLSSSEGDVRRAATHAIASVGAEVVPQIKARIAQAHEGERRALDAVLAELGGKDAFDALIKGLASSDPDAAKAAALAVRQQVKNADGLKRRSYLAATQKFLAEKKNKENFGAVAAALKILGYLEDEKTIPTLLTYVVDKKAHASVRQEAVIALRFALQKAKPTAKVVDALVGAAEAEDRTLAQTALHTLATLSVGDEVIKRLEKLAGHPDLERARFVIEQLGRMGGPEACRVLAKVLVTLDKRYAEIAAQALSGKDDAATPLAKALLEIKDRDRAWVIRGVIKPVAKKVPAALRKQLTDLALARLAKGELGWEAPLEVVRDADVAALVGALRELSQKLKRAKNGDKALTVLRLVLKTDKATDEDRYEVAALELARSARDTRPASRGADESLRLLGQLATRGFDVAKALRKDRSLGLEELYYVGFHFAEEGHGAGEELLEEVVKKGGRAKLGKMAKNKLALVRGE